jgi:pimeloyl-ACP methyl ester carboxylesterase
MIRRLIARLLVLAVVLIASALVVEYTLEARDAARYLPGQTFAQVGAAHIRYRMVGVNHPGATVVILTGIGGSIESVDELQTAVSSQVPALTYDRAGYGFSEGSKAHNAADQAAELAAVLQVLKIDKPVVLVAFSDSDQLARVFAGRYPEKTAAMYLIDAWLPEFDVTLGEHGGRRLFVRYVVHNLVASSLGIVRLTQRLDSWQGPESPVEQRAEAVLARRPHAWALAQEWYETPVSFSQSLGAPVPPTLPFELIFPKPFHPNARSKILAKLREALVARSSNGRLIEVEPIRHELFVKPGPMFDRIVTRVTQLSRSATP